MPSCRERLAGDLMQRLIRASAEDAKIWASAKGANFSRSPGACVKASVQTSWTQVTSGKQTRAVRRKGLWGLEFLDFSSICRWFLVDFTISQIMNSFTIVEQSFYTIYVLQNLLTQAQLEILLARLESWRLSLKGGVSSRRLETWHLCIQDRY